MKLTCPGCRAQYTVATERLGGRRATIRCKRCGESIAVDAAQQSGEVYASASTALPAPPPPPAPAPLTGERNESSVLFSMAMLAKPAPAPRAPAVTESSTLIDLRALMSSTAKADAPSAPRVDDIMSLGVGGGGAFAPLFGEPLAPPVTFAPAPTESERGARRGKTAFAIGVTALAVVATIGLVVAGARSKASAPAAKAVTVAVNAPVEVPSIAEPASKDTASVAPPASSMQAPLTPPKARTTPNVAPPARAAPTASTSNTESPAPKCCAGESEMACQMRLSAGAACSADPPARPFDRPAAARALGVEVASCKRGGSPTGAGHVKVTFQPGGSVSAVEVDAPYAGTAAGACVAQRYRAASVPSFTGGPLTVGKTFVIE